MSDRDKEAVERSIEAVKLGDIADKYFSELSDGQKQRVMLARAICQEPKVLILDEPTSYLDIHHKVLFLETLRELVREKKIAAVISMHEPDMARIISDTAVCVKNGSIYRIGTPDDIFRGELIRELYDIPAELYKKYFDLF